MLFRVCVKPVRSGKINAGYIITKLIDLFNFSIYIRIIMEAYQLLLISSFSEIINFNGVDSTKQKISIVSSFIIFSIWMLMLGLSFYLFYSTTKLFDPDGFYRLREYIAGVKDSKSARMYSFLLLSRKTIMVVWLIGFQSLSPVALSSGLLFVQVVYFTSIVILRPFDRTEGNVIEIVNEAIFSTLVSLIVWLDVEEDWSGLKNSVYIGLIMSNSLIITLIMMGK